MRGATGFALAGALALALISGCEAVKGVNDAGDDDDDATFDAGGPDAAWVRGTVTVEVSDAFGNPMPGVRVIFNEPDGSVASTQNTDENGVASFDLFPHSAVSIAFTEGSAAEFYIRNNVQTVLGVMPGDRIKVALGRDEFFSGNLMGTVRFDINATFPGATYYELRIGCESISTTNIGNIDWELYESSCNGGLQPVDVVVTARDAEYNPLAFSTHAGVPLDVASYTPVNTWRTDWAKLSAQLTNVPDGMSAAQAEMAVWRRGLDYGLGEPPFTVLDGTTSSAIDILFPPSFAERLSPQLLAMWGTFPDGINGFAQYQRQINAGDNELVIDLSNDLLPRVVNVSFEPNALVNSLVNFAIDGDVTIDATAGAGAIQWELTIPGSAGDPDTYVNWEWFFVMPPDVESPIQLPIVPAGSLPESAWPPPENAVITTQAVGFLDTTLRSSWDDFRQNNGFALLDNPMGPSTPAGSQLIITIGGLLGFD